MPAEDAFSFDISARHGSTIYNEVMPVLIAMETGKKRQRLLKASDLEVLEGEMTPGYSCHLLFNTDNSRLVFTKLIYPVKHTVG